MERVERGETKRLIVSMPPRHGKSLTSTIRFPGWWLGRHPRKRIIVAAHTADLAYTFSRRFRNELTQFGSDVFGVQVASDSSAVDRWELQGLTGGVVAAGVGGPINGQGADLLLIDDPIKNQEAALSPTQRETQRDWYRSTARTRVHPGGAIVLVMTRWHEDDLAGWLLEEAKTGGEQWEQVVLPMVDPSGGILWPERYSPDEVAALKRTSGSMWWSALFQQRPAPAEGAIFKREWFRYYRKHDRPGAFNEVILSWDCTFKDTDGTDFVSGHVWGRVGARKYLLERVHGRMDFVATATALEAQAKRWPEAHAKLVEDKANGPAVISFLRSKVPGLIAVEPDGSKLARAHATSPTVEAGDVFVPDPSDEPWVDEFLAEVCSFPSAPHDDDVDAMTQALRRFARSYAGEVVTAPKTTKPKVEM